MNSTIQNILSVISGLILGGAVNMGIILISGSIIPPPEGATDVTTTEGLKESIHLFQPKHFLLPFLAHALGTLAGALLAALIAANHQMKFALSIGVLFLIGGIINSFMLPAPTWFIVLDLVGAYIPMAWLGWKMSRRN